VSEPRDDSPEQQGELVYDLYQRGSALLEAGDFAAAAIPLERASRLEPDKTSIREALGRAYFRSGRFGSAAHEFEAVVERAPVNDFAHFCLGKALAKTGRRAEAATGCARRRRQLVGALIAAAKPALVVPGRPVAGG
jgi:Flp pilus assembly protein TadD